MRRQKIDNDMIRAALREWITPTSLANKLMVSKPTALNYIRKMSRSLESKPQREGVSGPAATAYRVR